MNQYIVYMLQRGFISQIIRKLGLRKVTLINWEFRLSISMTNTVSNVEYILMTAHRQHLIKITNTRFVYSDKHIPFYYIHQNKHITQIKLIPPLNTFESIVIVNVN